ncbi:hypothetical protein CCP1ISM_930002 [Azospirillaceae bacterium]
MDIYTLLLAFFRDHYVYEQRDINEKLTGKWTFGTEKDIGGKIYDLVVNHLFNLFNKECLIKAAREIRDYSDSIDKIDDKNWRDRNELESMVDIKRKEVAKRLFLTVW